MIHRHSKDRMALKGLRFCLTGTFEYGTEEEAKLAEKDEGARLAFGKQFAAQIVASHGGTVVTTVSGKTDYLLVGDRPGVAKLEAAAKNGRTRLLDEAAHARQSGRLETWRGWPSFMGNE